MSSPVGHALVGIIFFTAAKRIYPEANFSWKSMLLFIFLAGLPDLDVFHVFFTGWLGAINHRTLSHSLFFALLVGLVSAWLFQLKTKTTYKRLWWLVPATIISHPLMDMCCLKSVSPPGVELLWPFSNHFIYTPLPFMASIGTFKAMGNPIWLAFLKAASLETLVFGSLYLIIRFCFYIQDKMIVEKSG